MVKSWMYGQKVEDSPAQNGIPIALLFMEITTT